jgi:4-hydroxy-2-oxoheptanedioate aldolase
MKTNRLKELIRKNNPVFGPFMKFTDPAAVEIAALAGFDFVILDMEHGPCTVETAQNLVRAAQLRGITPVIRVSDNTPSTILRVLDIGAEAVQIPQIANKADALEAVRSAKFFPEGERGVCRYVRAADFSALDRQQHFQSSNQQTTIIVHIEGVEGIRNLPDILTVEHLDIIFLGPYDLSQSCKVPGQVHHPLVVEKMREAVSLAQQAHVAVGTFVESPEAAQKWIQAGVLYISYSVDVGIYLTACAEIVKQLRVSPR